MRVPKHLRRELIRKNPNLVRKAKHAIGFTISRAGSPRKLFVEDVVFERKDISLPSEKKKNWITRVMLVVTTPMRRAAHSRHPFQFGYWEFNPPRHIQKLQQALERHKKTDNS